VHNLVSRDVNDELSNITSGATGAVGETVSVFVADKALALIVVGVGILAGIFQILSCYARSAILISRVAPLAVHANCAVVLAIVKFRSSSIVRKILAGLTQGAIFFRVVKQAVSRSVN
jgi:hypothetical protein